MHMLRELAKRRWPRRDGSQLTQLVTLIPRRIHFRRGKRQLSEFEGGVLAITAMRRSILKMDLFVLEAKSGRRAGMSESNRQLREKLLKIGGLHSQGKIFVLLHKNAYARIELLTQAR
jgi:hypothetical protein